MLDPEVLDWRLRLVTLLTEGVACLIVCVTRTCELEERREAVLEDSRERVSSEETIEYSDEGGERKSAGVRIALDDSGDKQSESRYEPGTVSRVRNSSRPHEAVTMLEY
jgi:hypothetical protein